MVLVGATDDDKMMVLQLGDDASGLLLYAVQLTPERASSLIAQMTSVLASLNTSARES